MKIRPVSTSQTVFGDHSNYVTPNPVNYIWFQSSHTWMHTLTPRHAYIQVQFDPLDRPSTICFIGSTL